MTDEAERARELLGWSLATNSNRTIDGCLKDIRWVVEHIQEFAEFWPGDVGKVVERYVAAARCLEEAKVPEPEVGLKPFSVGKRRARKAGLPAVQ